METAEPNEFSFKVTVTVTNDPTYVKVYEYNEIENENCELQFCVPNNQGAVTLVYEYIEPCRNCYSCGGGMSREEWTATDGIPMTPAPDGSLPVLVASNPLCFSNSGRSICQQISDGCP